MLPHFVEKFKNAHIWMPIPRSLLNRVWSRPALIYTVGTNFQIQSHQIDLKCLCFGCEIGAFWIHRNCGPLQQLLEKISVLLEMNTAEYSVNNHFIAFNRRSVIEYWFGTCSTHSNWEDRCLPAVHTLNWNYIAFWSYAMPFSCFNIRSNAWSIQYIENTQQKMKPK